MKKKFWIGLIVIVLVIVIIASRGKGKKVVVPLVSTNAIHKDTVTTKINAKGVVQFKDNTLIYPNTQKIIDKVKVKVGDNISKGDVLVEYDTKTLTEYNKQLSDLKISLDIAKVNLDTLKLPATESELSQTQTQVIQSEKNVSDLTAQVSQFDISLEQITRDVKTADTLYQNNKTLFENGGLSKNDLDKSYESLKKLQDQLQTTKLQRQTALQNITTANESLNLAKTQYNALKNKASDAKYKNQIKQQELQVNQINLKIKNLNKDIADYIQKETSPINGTVISVNCIAGDTAMPGKSLFELATTDMNNLIVKVNVPENNSEGIRVGQKVELKTEASDNISEGVVTKIYPLAEKLQVSTSQEIVLPIEVSITNPKSDFRKGYSIDTNIITHVYENVLVTPLMSTVTESKNNFVYVVDENGTAHKKPIHIVAYADVVVVVEGDIKNGDKVIVNPPANLKDEMTVKEAIQK